MLGTPDPKTKHVDVGPIHSLECSVACEDFD
jgi:hypothetical protein